MLACCIVYCIKWVGELWVGELWVGELWVGELWVGELWVGELWVGEKGGPRPMLTSMTRTEKISKRRRVFHHKQYPKQEFKILYHKQRKTNLDRQISKFNIMLSLKFSVHVHTHTTTGDIPTIKIISLPQQLQTPRHSTSPPPPHCQPRYNCYT